MSAIGHVHTRLLGWSVPKFYPITAAHPHGEASGAIKQYCRPNPAMAYHQQDHQFLPVSHMNRFHHKHQLRFL